MARNESPRIAADHLRSVPLEPAKPAGEPPAVPGAAEFDPRKSFFPSALLDKEAAEAFRYDVREPSWIARQGPRLIVPALLVVSFGLGYFFYLAKQEIGVGGAQPPPAAPAAATPPATPATEGTVATGVITPAPVQAPAAEVVPEKAPPVAEKTPEAAPVASRDPGAATQRRASSAVPPRASPPNAGGAGITHTKGGAPLAPPRAAEAAPAAAAPVEAPARREAASGDCPEAVRALGLCPAAR